MKHKQFDSLPQLPPTLQLLSDETHAEPFNVNFLGVETISLHFDLHLLQGGGVLFCLKDCVAHGGTQGVMSWNFPWTEDLRPGICARIYRSSFRENKPKTLFFSHK